MARAHHPFHEPSIALGLDEQYRFDRFDDPSSPRQSYGRYRERRHGPQTPAQQPHGQLRMGPQDKEYDSTYETTDTGGPLATPFWMTSSGNAGTPATVPSSVSPTPFRRPGWSGMYSPPSVSSVANNMMQSGMEFGPYGNESFNRVSPQQQIDPAFQRASDTRADSIDGFDGHQTNNNNRIGGQEHGRRPHDDFHYSQGHQGTGARDQPSPTPADPIQTMTFHASPAQITQYACPQCGARFDTRSARR